MADRVERARHHSDVGAAPCGRDGSLSSSVAGPDHNNIEICFGGSQDTAHNDKLSASDIFRVLMPLPMHAGAPTLLIRRRAYEQSGLVRASLDQRLGLTADEFRVEGEVVAIGPIYNSAALTAFLEELERLGLAYYDDFFELSGNWPDWLSVLAGGGTGSPGRSNPSQPQR